MKKIFFACSLLLSAISMNAQDLTGSTLEDRLSLLGSADSLEVRQSMSLYRLAYKNNNWAEAIEPWRVVLKKGPLAQVRTYQDGAWMLENLVQQEGDAAKKNAYFEELMNLYDVRLANMDALNSFATPKTTQTKGNILCRKAYDYYTFCPQMDNNKAYEMFKAGIDDMGPNTEAFVLYSFINCSHNRYIANKDNADIRQDFIQDYMNVNDICDRLLDQAKEFPAEVLPANPESADSTEWVERVILAPEAQKIVDNYQPTQDKCNELFVSSGAADCDALEKIYGASVEANKTNIPYLKSVLQILSNFECEKSNMYYVAADYVYAKEKTPTAAIAKASKALKAGQNSEAIKFFDEAIAMEPSAAKKAKYAYAVAALYYKQGNLGQCRAWCKKTLSYNGSMGGAYLLQASCIARSATGDARDVKRSYYYCLATDYCNKAKAVDPSSASKANRQAAGYASHFYPKSEAFFAGIKAGQTVSVAGETTTLRLR